MKKKRDFGPVNEIIFNEGIGINKCLYLPSYGDKEDTSRYSELPRN